MELVENRKIIIDCTYRRVWNIEVGKMPVRRAEAYIKSMINKYKRNINIKLT